MSSPTLTHRARPRAFQFILAALVALLCILAGCSGGSSSTPPPPPQNPTPSIVRVSPSSVLVGSPSQTLTISGSNFLASSTVTFAGSSHTPTLVSETQLTIQLGTSDLSTTGNFPVIASNPAPGGGASNSVSFSVNNPVPALNTLAPAVIQGGSPDSTITVVGSNFVSKSAVYVNGTAMPTSFVSATQLASTLPANGLTTGRVDQITVTNPGPGGGTTSAANLIVAELLPTGISGPLIQSLPPAAALVGKPMQYQVVASSASPSSLAFSLVAPPAGMSIDPHSGLLQWTPGSNQVGDQSISIVAQDSASQTGQNFTLSVFGSRSVAAAKVSAVGGGTLTVSDPSSTINGLSVSIPAGALASDTTITISELSSPPTLGGTSHFLLKGFALDPDGTSLAAPATITIPYDPTQFATTQGIPLEDFLGLYYLNLVNGTLDLQSSFGVDKANHQLTGTVRHFSVYVDTNIARLCPPPLSDASAAPTDCPSKYAPLTASSLLPAVMVHGFQDVRNGKTMGSETTWSQLRYLLGQIDSGGSGRVDAWRFDWDATYTPFETSAGNLDAALAYVEHVTASEDAGLANPPPNFVNLVAHSFGGILVRTYLQNQASVLGSTVPYRGDVNRVMTLGTPHVGIGGNLSTLVADLCADAAQQITEQPRTCFEASTGIAGGLSFSGAGTFLNSLNESSLPQLKSSLTPQYVLITGQRISGCCSFQLDDGLVILPENNLCGNRPVVCSAASVNEESNPGNMPANSGLCHASAALLQPWCNTGENIPMTEVDDETHPLWSKICSFLGCALPTQMLTVTSANPNTGVAITVTPSDNDGQSIGHTQFTRTYNKGMVVNLGALPAPDGTGFSSWTGCDSASAATCTVTMNADRRVTANYGATAPPTHSLTVASMNPTTGVPITASPADNAGQTAGATQFILTYNSGTSVTLTAPVTAGGNNFSNWTGCDSTSAAACSVTLSSDRTVIANYAVSTPQSHTLTVASANPSSGASINAAPADNAGHSSGTTQFSLTYSDGMSVTLTASPTAGGHSFFSWTGCDAATGAACSLALHFDRTVTALYGSAPAFAYVANQNSGDVSAYSVDTATGALTSVGTFTSGLAPASVAADPTGHCLYVANSQDPVTPIAVFSINQTTGALTTGPSPSMSLSEIDPMSIVVHPSGKFAYAANFGGNVSAFTVNLSTCALTRISGSPFAAGTLPQFATIDPSGNFLYIGNLGDSNISGYKIDQTAGSLTPIASSPFPSGSLPTSLTIHQSGKLAFGTSSDSNVLVYTRDTTTGALTQIGPSPIGGPSFTTAIDLTGSILFVPSSNGGTTPGSAEIFTVNVATGVLTQVGLSATGESPLSVIVDPSGRFLYIANNGSGSVSEYRIDPNSGALSFIGNAPAGGGPISIAITSKPPGP
jgi:6-phosphogluconolactonase